MYIHVYCSYMYEGSSTQVVVQLLWLRQIELGFSVK